MQRDDCELASRRLVQAFYLDGTLSIFATGQVPLAGYEVSIERLSPSTNPPQFSVIQHRLAGIYADTAAPYTISRLFAMSECPRTAVLHHAEGKDAVTVVDIRNETASMRLTQTVLPIPYVFPPSALHNSRSDDIATGYSSAFDFTEALREALCALAPAGENVLGEYPRTIRVIEIGVEEGGVANFNHLFVRVQRRTVAPPVLGSDPSS